MKTPLISIPHVIANQNPQTCIDQVKEFTKGKRVTHKQYNTTPLIAGVDKLGNANIIIITSCLIIFDVTPDEKRSFEFQQSMQVVK